MKILIAEDDTASRVILAQLLKQLGHDVTATANGEEAWAVFQREHVPLLITDWLMPGLDGLELCRRIRAEGRPKYTYVILLTMLGGKANYLEAMAAGADDFISKPFDADELQTRLRVAERIIALQRELIQVELTREQVVQQERLRALGEMAGGIVHDFSNMLAPIFGYSSMLLARPEDLKDTTKVRRYLELIFTAAEGASHVVRRLREFYRRRDEVEAFLPVDVREVVATAVSLTEPKWKTEARAAGRTIRVETTLEEVAPVDGVAAQLRDVLTNLIFNAVDAMPHGGILTIRTGLDDSRSLVVTEVTDTGIGMPAEVRRRCLEPFFTTKGEHGTGLGLPMAYGIVQRHGGSIDIETEPGRGTTFVIRLPVRPVRGVLTLEPEAVAPSRSLRVLVVDDEPGPLEVIVEGLRGDGHTVETATNGVEGLGKFQAGWFEVVLTDWAMPKMNGVDLALNIKRIAPIKPVIIMLTGFGHPVDTPAGLVDLVLEKPVTLSQLREALAIVR